MSTTVAEETFAEPVPRLSVAALDRQQAIQTDYYTLTEPNGGPVAVLLVLLDRQRNPVRAELHLYAEASDEAREYSFRQGRALLERRYVSPELVPLQILESQPLGDAIQVRTEGINVPPPVANWWPNGQALAGLALLALLFLVIWGVWRWAGSATPAVEETQASDTAAPAASEVLPTLAPAVGDQNLPASVQANPNLAVGKRIRVLPNLQVWLVRDPGPDGTRVGVLQDQQEATIIDGPVLTQGKSDTIVWWRIRLDDGAEAWAPANTSEVALLALVE